MRRGSFWIRSSVLFLNCHISWRSTVPGWYFLDFFTLPACKNSFWGALSPMVGWSFLWASSSPPNVDGLVSAAIWTNCWVANDDGDHPTSSNCSTSSTHFSISPALGGASLAGEGVNLRGGLFPFFSQHYPCHPSPQHSHLTTPLPLPWCYFVLAMLEFRWGRLGNVEVVRPQSHESHVAAILNF